MPFKNHFLVFKTKYNENIYIFLLLQSKTNHRQRAYHLVAVV